MLVGETHNLSVTLNCRDAINLHSRHICCHTIAGSWRWYIASNIRCPSINLGYDSFPSNWVENDLGKSFPIARASGITTKATKRISVTPKSPCHKFLAFGAALAPLAFLINIIGIPWIDI
jgi:hypothetical protein